MINRKVWCLKLINKTLTVADWLPISSEHFWKSRVLNIHKKNKIKIAIMKDFFCEECALQFGKKLVFDLHLSLVHERKTNTKTEPNMCDSQESEELFPSHKNNKYARCETCNSCFSSNFSLKKHYAKFHAGEKPLKSDKTDVSFPLIESLNENSKSIFEKNKKFKCDKCNAYFRRKSSLNSHISSIHEGKYLECDWCSAKFPTKRNLDRHIQTVHDGKKQFKCDMMPTFLQNIKEKKLSVTDAALHWPPNKVSKTILKLFMKEINHSNVRYVMFPLVILSAWKNTFLQFMRGKLLFATFAMQNLVLNEIWKDMLKVFIKERNHSNVKYVMCALDKKCIWKAIFLRFMKGNFLIAKDAVLNLQWNIFWNNMLKLFMKGRNHSNLLSVTDAVLNWRPNKVWKDTLKLLMKERNHSNVTYVMFALDIKCTWKHTFLQSMNDKNSSVT